MLIVARDIGVDVLTQPGGLRKFVDKLRDVVFPRASEEARELQDWTKARFPSTPESRVHAVVLV